MHHLLIFVPLFASISVVLIALYCLILISKKKKNKLVSEKLVVEMDKEMKNSRWGDDLLDDIVKLIMGKLSFVDQQRFRCVCRKWSQKNCMGRVGVGGGCNGLLPAPAKQLPWLFNHDNGSCYKLFDPLYRKTYPINDNSFPVVELTVWASKESWLLMSHTNFIFFFYNPFTREYIQLLKLGRTPKSATFSSTPTSPDCTVYVVHFDSHVTISKCQPGDKAWTRTIFNCGLTNLQNLSYLDGVLYCFALNAEEVAAFNIYDGSWTLIAKAKLPNFEHIHLVESRGELLMVCFNCESPCETFLLKLVNQGQGMSWVALDRLGNRTLFITSVYSISIEVSYASSSTIGGIETDGIYYADDFCLWFYSFKDGTSYTSKIYPMLKPSAEFLFRGYIEPPSLHC